MTVHLWVGELWHVDEISCRQPDAGIDPCRIRRAASIAAAVSTRA